MNIAEPILKIGEMLRILIEDIKEIKEKVEKLERLADEQERRRMHDEWKDVKMMGEYR